MVIPILIGLAVLIVLLLLAKWLLGIVYIPENKIGLVTKKFVLFGPNKSLPEGRILALNGEAGYQANTLAPGIYFWYWPWQFAVDRIPFVMIPEGQLGLLVANDGSALPPNRVLGKKVPCDSFQNAKAFLEGGGQKGRQVEVLSAGTYRINPALFKVEVIVPILRIPLDNIGIVTALDGEPSSGELAGHLIDGHKNFQDPQQFIDQGGIKGLQEQVLLPGAYNLNPWFVTVDAIPMTEVPIGHVGVVISFIGKDGSSAEDSSGKAFKHGNIYPRGYKGVWQDVLEPGKYPINTFVQDVRKVPTTNILLNWANTSEAHGLDARLSSINVRSQDGFTLKLDVSQIIHIPADQAPKVISAVGSVANLVSQVLEPTIGNYFRNSAQASNAIDFIKERRERQQEGKEYISTILDTYSVHGVDTLIGDIVPPQEVMNTLTDRKIAEMQKETFDQQRQAAEKRQELQKAQAMADIQSQLVSAEQGVTIAERNANAAVKQAEGKARATELQGTADANANKARGKADAEVIQAKGMAEAEVIEAKGAAEAAAYKAGVEAMGDENFARIQVTRTLATNNIKIIPDILVQGGNGAGNGNDIGTALVAQVLQQTSQQTSQHDKPAGNPLPEGEPAK